MSDKVVKSIVDEMSTDLARAAHYLRVARANVERGKAALAATQPDLWERVAYVESELALLIDRIKEQQK